MVAGRRVLITIIGLATAMPWVLVGCATTSAPAQDVSWLVGRWQGEFTARGTLARVGATSGPVTMELRDEGGGFVSGEITGMATPCTLRGRGTDTGYAGSASIVSSVAGNFEMPFEFTRRSPNTLEGTLQNSELRFQRK